jgi:hypothetical protein
MNGDTMEYINIMFAKNIKLFSDIGIGWLKKQRQNDINDIILIEKCEFMHRENTRKKSLGMLTMFTSTWLFSIYSKFLNEYILFC